MRKLGLLWMTSLLLVTLIAGCNGNEAAPSPAPSVEPSPVAEAGSTEEPDAPVLPTVAASGPATCQLEPVDLSPNPNIPPVTEEDHALGDEDAPIVFIEYADFQ